MFWGIIIFIIQIFKQKFVHLKAFILLCITKYFYMNKDKALESVNEIKELMEKSSKFISLSGLAAIMAGIYALVGAYIATQVITPSTYSIVALELMVIIASLVLIAAAVTTCILSYYKSKKLRHACANAGRACCKAFSFAVGIAPIFSKSLPLQLTFKKRLSPE